jgi:hypothetical protein
VIKINFLYPKTGRGNNLHHQEIDGALNCVFGGISEFEIDFDLDLTKPSCSTHGLGPSKKQA